MDLDDMPRIAAAYETISDKVRALHASGYARSQIAKFLQRHPTQVRNIIKADEIRGRPVAPRKAAAVMDAAMASDRPATVPQADGGPIGEIYRLEVEDGAIRLPPEVLKRLGIGSNGVVVAQLHAGRFSLLDREENLKLIRSIAPPSGAEGRSLSEELIAERRREAAGE